MGKRLRVRLITGCLLFLVGPIACYYLARFTYHQGWWGRDNLVARSLWLCSAPSSLEETFYPENVDVLVPACQNIHSGGGFQWAIAPLPSHQYIIAPCDFDAGRCLLNVYTYEKTPLDLSALLPGDHEIQRLTDELVVVAGGENNRGYFLVDLSTGQRLRLASLRSLGLLEDDGSLKVVALVEALRKSDKVYLIDDTFDTIYALAPDFWGHSTENFKVEESLLPADSLEPLNTFLDENHIPFVENKADCGSYTIYTYPQPLPSPSGRFVAKWNGIYDVATDALLAPFGLGEVPPVGAGDFEPCFWLPDESAVVLSYNSTYIPALIGGPHDTGQDPGFLFRVPQPVLKFNLPKDLWQPAPTEP